MEETTIAVWFSCGAASAVAAKKTIEIYKKTHKIRVLNNPVAEEHPDNRRFLKDVEAWIDHPIEFVINSKWPNCSIVEVWDKKKAMSFDDGAPCTAILKKQARFEWERQNDCHAMVFGFTTEEKHRHNSMNLAEFIPTIPVLIQLQISKKKCFDILREAKISLPQIYLEGFPNANCIGCSKATAPEYWNLVRRRYPDVFEQRVEQSRRLGVKLVRVRGKRIFLDELHPMQRSRKIKPIPPYQCSLFCS